MPLIERYILRRAAYVFLFALGALTGAVWATQVLERLDIVTAKGQAIWVFVLLTMLVLPAVIQVVTPVALLLAVIITLNSLTDDSELPVIAAAGASQKAVARPIVTLGVLVTLALIFSYHVLTPAGLSLFRTILAEVRADVIATLLQDGGFRAVDSGLTMHFRERAPEGGFRDVFINDERDPQEQQTFSAAHGLLVEHAGGPFLILQDGDLIRQDRDNAEGSVLNFETYALDLRQIGSAGAIPVYRAVERSTLFLLNPPPGDEYSERYPLKVRAEIYDRLAAPLYPLAFVLIALGFLGRPSTNRQDRSVAIATVVLLCIVLRAAGFAAFSVGRNVSAITPLIIAVPVIGIAFGIYAGRHDVGAWTPPGLATLAGVVLRARRRLSSGSKGPAQASDLQ